MNMIKHIKSEALIEGAPGGPVVEAHTVDANVDSEELAFADFSDTFGDEDLVDETPPAEIAPAPAPTPAPAVVVEEPARPAQPVVEAPTATVREEVREEPVVVESKPAWSEEQIVAQRSHALAELEKRYALGEDDAAAMVSEPEVVLPKIAARMYMDIFDGVMRGVMAYIPGSIQNTMRVQEKATQDESDFYKAWPALNSAQHKGAVERMATMYRQANPQATKEAFIQDVGLLASVNLKLPLPGAQQPAAPAATQRQAPPKPGGSGVVTTPAAGRPGEGNIFSDLADSFLADDRM
jgi:hypothetical protein